jgi:DNA polymerase III subunit delta'
VAFEAVRGQDPAVAILRRAIASGRIAHAWAFVGAPGAGRRLTAVEFAKALVAPDGGAAAGRIERGAHPDVWLMAPTPNPDSPRAAPTLRIEAVRDLERKASHRPVEGPWNVFVLDDAEKMTPQAAQAFLKTLEEPPARTLIVLILPHRRALPPTVLSRCQVVRFAPVTQAGALPLLPAAGGRERAPTLHWLGAGAAPDAEAILARGEAVGRDREAALALVETCWLWYRDLLCLQAGGARERAVFAAHGDVLEARAARCALDEVLGGLGACREAWRAIQGNVSPRLTVEVLMGRLGLQRAA